MSGILGMLLVIFIAIAVIYALVIQPVLAIIFCTTNTRHQTHTKVIWVVLILFFWSLASAWYGALQKHVGLPFRISSVVSIFSLGFLFFYVILTPSAAKNTAMAHLLKSSQAISMLQDNQISHENKSQILTALQDRAKRINASDAMMVICDDGDNPEECISSVEYYEYTESLLNLLDSYVQSESHVTSNEHERWLYYSKMKYSDSNNNEITRAYEMELTSYPADPKAH